MRTLPQRRLFYLQPGVPNPFSYESRVRFFRFRESLSGAPENLLRLRLLHAVSRIAFASDFQCEIQTVRKKHGISRQHGCKSRLHIPKFSRIRKSHAIFFQSLVKLCLLHGAKLVQKPSDHRILQHEIAHSRLNVNQKTGSFPVFSQHYGPKQYIVTAPEPLLHNPLIFRNFL